MNCGSVGFLMNTFSEDDLPGRLARAQAAVLYPLRMHAVSAGGGETEALAFNEVSCCVSCARRPRSASRWMDACGWRN